MWIHFTFFTFPILITFPIWVFGTAIIQDRFIFILFGSVSLVESVCIAMQALIFYSIENRCQIWKTRCGITEECVLHTTNEIYIFTCPSVIYFNHILIQFEYQGYTISFISPGSVLYSVWLAFVIQLFSHHITTLALLC